MRRSRRRRHGARSGGPGKRTQQRGRERGEAHTPEQQQPEGGAELGAHHGADLAHALETRDRIRTVVDGVADVDRSQPFELADAQRRADAGDRFAARTRLLDQAAADQTVDQAAGRRR